MQNIAQLRGWKPACEFEGPSQRSVFVPQQRTANFRTHRPLRVMADGFDESGGCGRAQQRFDDGGLRKTRILQRSLPDARFSVGQ